ncbi:MAG: hypothetical protein ABSH20_17120 [Tepidisphaeraceae bacterium]|jgi:hypothetical protein
MLGPQETGQARAAVPAGGTPRMQCADRGQAVISWDTLDERLAEEHQACLLWADAESADLALLYEKKRQARAKPEPAAEDRPKDDQDKDREEEGKKKEPSPPRVSTTNPEAPVMKMGDGGLDPKRSCWHSLSLPSIVVNEPPPCGRSHSHVRVSQARGTGNRPSCFHEVLHGYLQREVPACGALRHTGPTGLGL